MGEAASTVCCELAKRFKRAPRQIAQEIANALGGTAGNGRVEVDGGGYLNAYFDRVAFWGGEREKEKGQRRDGESAEERREGQKAERGEERGKVIVEHTSINPNKAAHIGHVRNAVMSDTMVRILLNIGNREQVQNYNYKLGTKVCDLAIHILILET